MGTGQRKKPASERDTGATTKMLGAHCDARLSTLRGAFWRAANWRRILGGTSALPQDLEGIRAASYRRRSCPNSADVMVHLRL